MKRSLRIILLLLLGCPLRSGALPGPSFNLESSAWYAPDIVVGKAISLRDGHVQVLEVWKGDLKPGTILEIPELSTFAAKSARVVSPGLFATNRPPVNYVTGQRMVLFLHAHITADQTWEARSPGHEIRDSVVWIEGGNTYAFLQESNPGPSLLTPLWPTEDKLKRDALAIIETEEAMARILQNDDLPQRPEQLRPFARSELWTARHNALAAIGKCGTNGLAVLRSMLTDETMANHHDEVIRAMGAAAGTSVGPELTTLVQTELQFWKQTAPGLKDGWWNGAGLKSTEAQDLRNRYLKLQAAVRVLGDTRYKDCVDVVTDLRDLWRSLPQLEDQDRNGLTQMSDECDSALEQLR